MLNIDRVVLGKYRVERILGQGGMALVAQARHQVLDQAVALKLLRDKHLDDADLVERFVREARTAVMLTSEHTCRIHDVGTLDHGAPCIVMEHLDGVDLAELVAEHGPLEPGVAIDYVLQACEALAEAHALGIIHRDIKPSNLFLTRRSDGSYLIKLLDFGVSKASLPSSDELTDTYAVLGTPYYMSPEQLRCSKFVDTRTDVWSLGVVLYELLTGRRPFEARVFSELCCQVLLSDPAPIPIALPGELDEVVMRCLRRHPSDRYHDVAALVAALAPYARTPRQAATSRERTARLLGAHDVGRAVCGG